MYIYIHATLNKNSFEQIDFKMRSTADVRLLNFLHNAGAVKRALEEPIYHGRWYSQRETEKK